MLFFMRDSEFHGHRFFDYHIMSNINTGCGAISRLAPAFQHKNRFTESMMP
jgi:hypothetical protein